MLDGLHDRLWAEARRSVVLVLQGMDASGKDGTIRRVLTGLNPQGCSVVNFKAPTHARPRPRLPLAHPRRHARRAGSSGSGTGRTTRTSSPPVCIGVVDERQARQRYRQIREFERHARRRGHHDREGVPPRVEGRAAGPPPGPDRRPGEELEVPPRRPRHPGAAGTSTRRATTPRSPPRRPIVGAVVRRARRPQVGARRRGRLAARRRADARSTRRSPRPKPGLEGLVVE